MFDYKLAYLFGTIILLVPVWIFIFVLRRNLRRKMLLLGFFGSIVGPVYEVMFYRDYWKPESLFRGPVRIEDVLLGFLAVSLSGTLFPFLFRKTMKGEERKGMLGIIFLMYTIALVIMFTLFLSSLNSIYASIISTTLMTTGIILVRRDLLVPSIVSGVLFLVLAFLGYQLFLSLYPEAISRWWMLTNISNIFIGNVPIEEYVWAFTTGGFTGVIYEFASNKKFED